jgi:hypothetical protein
VFFEEFRAKRKTAVAKNFFRKVFDVIYLTPCGSWNEKHSGQHGVSTGSDSDRVVSNETESYDVQPGRYRFRY